MTERKKDSVERLTELFGNYRAEWLRERIFDLYTQPSYFPDLETKTPCMLMGGRGTGKTTVLRSLSYEGRYALTDKNLSPIPSWDYYGFYYRVDTNKVTAFQGPELSDLTWTKLFAHYVNILLCGQVLKFLKWYALLLPDAQTLSGTSCEKIALSLCIPRVRSVPDLIDALDTSRIEFEAFLNNLSQETLPQMSLQGAPIGELLARVIELPQFASKHFFFLIDEFENFTDPQQMVMNTLIKHSGENHSFKIGVKELGWRKRATLNPNEQLNSPADYVRINIADHLTGSKFQEMAAQICNQRLSQSNIFESVEGKSIEQLLPNLTLEEEAALLGLKHDALLATLPQAEAVRCNDLATLELYFCLQWAKWNKLPFSDVLDERARDQKKWNDRFSNYKHALLFTIRRGKSGIRKYYAGWRTFVQLSGSNIRYLLELVHRTLVLHREHENPLNRPVSFEDQTLAAQNVGMKNVAELEGVSVQGAQLTKLVLGLGRVFQILAYHPEGHSPEQNHFTLAETGLPPPETVDLLNAAVMHLALVRSAGTKLAGDGDVKAYDYSLHPIFAPFFVFSYRKKRKITLAPEELLGLIVDSKATIREIVSGADDEAPLPEQLRLFEGYYGSAA